MLRNLLQQLDERFPEVSQWLGGRLDVKLPAFMTSVIFHIGLLLALGMVGYGANVVARHEITSSVIDNSVTTDLSREVQAVDLDMPNTPPTQTAKAGSFAPNLAPTINAVPTSSSSVPAVDGGTAAPVSVELAHLDVKRATDSLVPTASLYGTMVSIKGNGAEHVGSVEGGVDRIANEILARLEKGRVLAIWMFDASGSLVAERERLSKHIDTVYTHITQLDENNRSADGGLLTAVVAFGQERKIMTEPTADKAAIVKGINDVPLDTTGVENTFGTVTEVVHKWGKYKDSKGNVYHPMIIIVTDEVGDDESRLEEAIATAAPKGKPLVPIYILGSQALFGRADGYMDYTDPKTKQVFRGLPVRMGPESATIEQVRLPFWYQGFQYDIMDSGFGPWALSRLADATGGIYFITRMGPQRMGFDPALMHEYKPDRISRQQYEATVMNNEFRAAIINAALISQQKLPGTPPLNFPPADTPEFKDAMRDGQVVVERTEYTVDECLQPITHVAKMRDHETSRRWQANYDLTRGRLLAMKVRCYEYNWLCAKMKRDPLKFQNSASNAWKLVPDPEVKSSEKAAGAAKEAKRLLETVLKEHPGTPWALFAQRELKDPFGFKWVETTVKPLPPKKQGDADEEEKKKKKAMMPKPPPPPKL